MIPFDLSRCVIGSALVFAQSVARADGALHGPVAGGAAGDR